MARNREDREDLFVEARGLTVRAEFRSATGDGFLIIGQKPNGWYSVYLSHDEVIHFDEAGQIRRAFWQGVIYRSHGDRLARLERLESSQETTYLRRDLQGAELADVLKSFEARLQNSLTLLVGGCFHISRAEPATAETESTLQNLFRQAASQPIRLAAAIRKQRD